MNSSVAARLALLSRQAGRLPTGSTAGLANGPAGPGAAPGRTEVPAVYAQSAAAEAATRPDTGASLNERIQRIAPRATAFVRPSDEELAARLGGRLSMPGLIEIEYRHPLSVPHGCRALDMLAAPDLDWLTGPSAAGAGRARLVFIDTETTGLAGGTGTLAFLVGVARVKGTALVVTQWLITRFCAEPALLAALLEALGRGPAGNPSAQGTVELVSYNGKSFDLPLLCTRLRMARMGAGLAGLAHHDLLHPLRTAFARRWPDCRLQTAERLLLGLERTDDLPGHRIPAVWADFVQFGETRELAALVQHNRIDLLSLAALLPALAQVFVDPAAPLPASVAQARQALPDSAAIARMQRRQRRPECARAHLLAARAAMDDRALLELADLHRARGDWALAVPIWQALADAGGLDAAEALAKYHEHVSRDLAQAIRWCESLCRAAPADPAHASRLRRLLQRRQRHGALFG